MTCHEYADRVEELIDGLLQPEEATRFDTHASECEECAAVRDDAERFRAVLATRGHAALVSWEASRLALRAASLPGLDDVRPAGHVARLLVPGRVAALRLVAASLIVGAAGYFGAGLYRDGGPRALAEGIPTQLESGEMAVAGSGGRRITAEVASYVRLEAGSDGAALALDSGMATIRLAPGEEIVINTPRGSVRAVGASFCVEVRGDGSVSVTVISGDVEFVKGAERTALACGDRFEIDEHDRPCLISRTELENANVEAAERTRELERLAARLDGKDEQLAWFQKRLSDAQNEARGVGKSVAWDELGGATWVLMDARVSRRDGRYADASAKFVDNSAGLAEELGKGGAITLQEALLEPIFMQRIASGFVDALAPEANRVARESVAADLRQAMAVVQQAVDDRAVPARLAVERQHAFMDLLRSVERNLGADAAARLAASLPRYVDVLAPAPDSEDSRTVERVVHVWSDRFQLDPDQQKDLRSLAETYVKDVLKAQVHVVASLPPVEVEETLFPKNLFLPGAGAGEAGEQRESDRSVADSGVTTGVVSPVAGSSTERVASLLRRMGARIAVAEPRIRFEQELLKMLTPQQRARGFGITRVQTFRAGR